MRPSRRGRPKWLTALQLLLAVLIVGSTMAAPTYAATVDATGPEERPQLGSVEGIAHTNFTGTGIAVRQNNVTYVWQDGHTVLTATVFPLNESGSHDICLDLVQNGSTVHDHGCTTRDVEGHGAKVKFNLQELGTNRTGPHELVLTLSDGDENDTVRTPITVITRDGDVDNDQLSNEREVKLGTDLNDTDTDSDTLIDGLEVDKYGTSPLKRDTDGDGLNDPDEVGGKTNATKADTDDDGLDDGEEVNNYSTDPMDPDTDGDGIPDGEEVEQGTNPADTPTSTPDESTGTPAEVMGRFSGIAVGLGALLLLGLAFAVYVRYDGAPRAGDATVGPGGVGPSSADEAPDEALASIDPEMLSPEQYVDRLLEAHGGQMKQSEIVEQTDWSKAKVSRTLKGMEEEGTVERTRIGRGNVVSYPGEEPGKDL